MRLVIPGPPVTLGGGRVVVRQGKAYRYPSPGGAAYLGHVRACWRASGLPRLEEPLALIITACFPIPPSAGARRRALMARGFHLPARRPDADAMAAAIRAALTGLAFSDDRQIVRLEVVKRYASQDPQVVVELLPAPIWEDAV